MALGVLREAPPDEILASAAWNVLAGGASVVAMAGLTIFLERPFGITSHLRLLELLSPDETVIRRMQLEAPGTYTHSLMVATLAEAAAKRVGADSLLCRVAVCITTSASCGARTASSRISTATTFTTVCRPDCRRF